MDTRRPPSDLWNKLKPLAREMRHEPTLAEQRLWKRLRTHRLHHAHFRRQHTIGPFIVDFFCHTAQLVIEVAGEIHQYTPQEDAIRQEYLESLGLRVLRFSNGEVLQQTNAVLECIGEVLAERISSSA